MCECVEKLYDVCMMQSRGFIRQQEEEEELERGRVTDSLFASCMTPHRVYSSEKDTTYSSTTTTNFASYKNGFIHRYNNINP